MKLIIISIAIIVGIGSIAFLFLRRRAKKNRDF